jgi:hypothetical protein
MDDKTSDDRVLAGDRVAAAQMGRRQFVAGAAASVVWLPAFRVSPVSAQATCAPPPNFPTSIPIYQQAYQNWSGDIQISSL